MTDTQPPAVPTTANGHRERRPWTEEEDRLLREAIARGQSLTTRPLPTLVSLPRPINYTHTLTNTSSSSSLSYSSCSKNLVDYLKHRGPRSEPPVQVARHRHPCPQPYQQGLPQTLVGTDGHHRRQRRLVRRGGRPSLHRCRGIWHQVRPCENFPAG
jgi:hypothetical protein